MGDEAKIKKLLSGLKGKPGVLGCLVIESAGSVVSSSLPADVDIQMIAALTRTLFSNEDVTMQRKNRGNVIHMSLNTDQGTLYFYEITHHFLVVLTDKEQRKNLDEVIQSIEDQD